MYPNNINNKEVMLYCKKYTYNKTIDCKNDNFRGLRVN